jgi:hypothetical protein
MSYIPQQPQDLSEILNYLINITNKITEQEKLLKILSECYYTKPICKPINISPKCEEKSKTICYLVKPLLRETFPHPQGDLIKKCITHKVKNDKARPGYWLSSCFNDGVEYMDVIKEYSIQYNSYVNKKTKNVLPWKFNNQNFLLQLEKCRTLAIPRVNSYIIKWEKWPLVNIKFYYNDNYYNELMVVDLRYNVKLRVFSLNNVYKMEKSEF